MPKIKVFLWQLCHNALPSRGLLLKRQIALDPVCLSCQFDIESIEHIFKVCPMTIKVWELAGTHSWLPSIPFDNPSISLCGDLNDLSLWKSSHFTKIILTLWSIWKVGMQSSFIRNLFRNLGPCYVQNVIGLNGNPTLIQLFIHLPLHQQPNLFILITRPLGQQDETYQQEDTLNLILMVPNRKKGQQ